MQVRVVCLNRHQYAPELNRAELSNGNWIKTPYCQTIEEANAFYEKSLLPEKRYAVRNENGSFSYSKFNPMIKMHG
jgi:hypothetical protein